MKHWSRHLAIAILIVLPFLYFNCSKMLPAIPPAGDAGNGFPGTPSNATNSFQVLSNGQIQVWQDKELRYSPTNGTAGTYTITGIPAWATFDSATGTIIGVPHKITDTGTFTITQNGGLSYGPYQIAIVGDPLTEQEWHLINTGQAAFALTPGSAGQDIHYSQSVKNNYLGIGVRLAISDSGVVISHPDLSANVLPGESRNYNNTFAVTQSWLGDPTPAAAHPEDAHGTAVAGLAAEKGWNGIGGRGVAPEARFAAFMFLPAQDKLAQEGLTDAALYDQFTGNFDIFNYSWGDSQCQLTEYAQNYTDKLAAGVANQRGGKGSVYQLAAGNSFIEDVNDCVPTVAAGTDFVLGNGNFSELNTTPYTVNVAAVNALGVSASYSTPGSSNWISSTGGEYGWSKAQANAPELSQPALITTDYPGCTNGLSSLDAQNSSFDNGTSNTGCLYSNTMNGTSGATPTVTGATALMLQANPNLTWRDVKYILAKTADKIDPNNSFPNHPVQALNLTGHTYELPWITNAAGFHFHNWYGFGRINVDNAVAMAKVYTSALGTFKSTGFKYDSGALTVAIPDNNAAGITRTFAVTDNLSVEAVQLRISISNCAGDMGIELTSPSGTQSILLNINSKLRDGAILNHIFLSNAFYGEAAAGTWTLKVLDAKATCTANLTNWKLGFFGH
jgi:hypothetical protein